MITSFRNPLVKRIKRLRQKKYRRQEGAFFAEGLRVVLAAVEQGAPVESIVYSPELLTSSIVLDMIAAQEAAGRPSIALAADVFESISERDNPRGLGAIIHAAEGELASLPVTPDAIFVALFNIADPGNLGTILRAIDAAGATGLILVGETTDPFQSEVARASMGALFSVPVSSAATPDALWTWASKHRLFTVATSAHAEQIYWDAGYRFPLLLLMGSEREGLDAATLARADLAVTIPMHGSASSLNLAIATGLILYELRRRL